MTVLVRGLKEWSESLLPAKRLPVYSEAGSGCDNSEKIIWGSVFGKVYSVLYALGLSRRAKFTASRILHVGGWAWRVE